MPNRSTNVKIRYFVEYAKKHHEKPNDIGLAALFEVYAMSLKGFVQFPSAEEYCSEKIFEQFNFAEANAEKNAIAFYTKLCTPLPPEFVAAIKQYAETAVVELNLREKLGSYEKRQNRNSRYQKLMQEWLTEFNKLTAIRSNLHSKLPDHHKHLAESFRIDKFQHAWQIENFLYTHIYSLQAQPAVVAHSIFPRIHIVPRSESRQSSNQQLR